MSNLHRIQWIDAQLREGRYPNCARVAEEFGISVRQASRDVEYLKYSLSAPVEYSFSKRGFFYTESAFVLPGLFLGEEEKETIHYLADRYRSVGGEMMDRLAALFEKLDPGRADRQRKAAGGIPVYSLKAGQVKTYHLLKEAAAARRKVQIAYLDNGNRRSRRVIRPYLVYIREKADYVHAFCETRQAERDFRLDRIERLDPLDESFSVPQSFDPGAYSGAFRFALRLPYRARLRFQGTPPGPELLALTDAGEGVHETEFRDSREFLGKLFSCGIEFTILSPLWLRRNCFDLLTRLRDNNSITHTP